MARPARTPIPRKIQASIMIRCRDRCALCFHWDGDTSVKAGQLAHIDRDRTNHAEANLAFLCQIHHDQYDTTPSQTRRVMPEVLTQAKQQLEQAIADGRHLTGPRSKGRGQKTDRKYLEQLQTTMECPLRFLRGVSFASHSFVNWELTGLDEVARRYTGAEDEFIDRDLEALRKELVQAGGAFFDVVYLHTERVPYNHNCRAVPRTWEAEEPTRYQEAVTVLDAAAVRVCEAYDALIRLGRAKLLP